LSGDETASEAAVIGKMARTTNEWEGCGYIIESIEI
jgi:hypothetical protein